MKPQVDLSITIASYNTKSYIKNCLDSIFRNTSGINFEVIVVDNASADDSVKMIKKDFPKVKLISNQKNLYFSKAYNQALKKSGGRYCLVLNSDTIIPKNSLKKIFLFMENHPEDAASSCRQVNDKGQIDKTCSLFPTPIIEFLESNILTKPLRPNKILKRYRYNDWKRNTSREVDVIPGSFMFIRKKTLEKVGYFDENLFLYYGENDLCLRIKKAGLSVYHNPKVTIIHLQSQSINKLPTWQLFQITLHDMLYYYKKHFGLAWWLFLWITYRANWIYWRLQSFK